MGFSLGSRSLIFTLPTVTGSADGNTQYKNLVTNTASANLVAFWPMDEISGTTADNAEGTAARDGTFSNVTLNAALNPFGGAAGSWNGSTSYNNIYTASLASAFNGAEGTMMVWGKMSAAAVWTDSAEHYLLHLFVDSNNRVLLAKAGTNNTLRAFYRAGGTIETIDTTSIGGSTSWFQFVITWSASNDRVRGYLNGAQYGVDQTALGTFAGSLLSTSCTVGAQNTTPTTVWSGNVAYAAIWDTELTAAQILTLYNGGPI